MHMHRSIIVGCVTACVALLAPPGVLRAADSAGGVSPRNSVAADPFPATDALADDRLVRYRGGAENTTSSTNNLQGNVGGNTATGTVSGDNIIDGGAFANSAGISTVIQNSGNNVLIQNGTAVNVEFLPPGP